METPGKSQVASWVFGLSLILVFSVHLENSSRITFPPRVGDHFQVLKVSEWVGDQFQVVKVSEGTCTVLRTTSTLVATSY